MDGRLIVMTGQRAGTEFILEAGPQRIGRDSTCQHRFAAEETVVSGHHATVFLRDGRWILRDEGSRNGTWAGDQRIEEIELLEGMVLRFGQQGPAVRYEVIPTTQAVGVGPLQRNAPLTNTTSGLSALYRQARDQVAAAGGNPTQGSVVRAFVKLAQERSARRNRLVLAAVVVVALAASGTVYFLGERKAASLQAALVGVTGQLAQTNDMWQRRTDSLEARFREGLASAEAERRALTEAREAAGGRGSLGTAAAARFAGGVGLIDARTGWYNPAAGWVRLVPTPNGDVGLTNGPSGLLAVAEAYSCTGFLVDSTGWVVTNRHCVQVPNPGDNVLSMTDGTVFRRTVERLRIGFPPNRVFEIDPASVIISTDHDVAVMRLTRVPANVPVLTVAGDRTVAAGEDLVLLAYPGGALTTLQRRLANDADTTVRQTVFRTVRSSLQAFDAQPNVPAVIRRLPGDSASFDAALRASIGLQLLLRTRSATEDGALFEGLAAAGQIDPVVSARLTVAGVRARSISFQTLGGTGGSSGGPVLAEGPEVVGVNNAFIADQDRGAQFQQNEAVPASFVRQLLARRPVRP